MFECLLRIGQRILAQTIIPGILNSEQNQRVDFGSVDEGQTIHCQPEVIIIVFLFIFIYYVS